MLFSQKDQNGVEESVLVGKVPQGTEYLPAKEGSYEELQPGVLSLNEDTAGGMGRHLGLTSTTSLIICTIVGTGIFSTPSSVTESVGSVGAALMLWVLGLALSFAGLCVWLEFGCMFPRSGGEKVYLEAVYQRPRFLATVIFSIQAILLSFNAANCIIFATNILIAADQTLTEWGERGIAIGVIVFVTLIHSLLPKWGVRVVNFLGVIKVIILAFVVVTGWVVLSGRIDKIPDPHASFRNSFAGSSRSGYDYATALFKVLDSYEGWSVGTYVLNEVRRPVRTLKIAGPLALGVCGSFYILANVAYYSVATPQEIDESGATVAAYFFGRVFGASGERALSVFVALSALGTVMSVAFTSSRVYQELAKEGVLPFSRFWASSWPSGAPSAGLLIQFVTTFVVIIAVPFGDAYYFILDIEGYPNSVISLFVVIGLFILRWRAPHVHRPFKVWWPVAVFFLIAQAFLMVAPFLRPPGGIGDTSLPYWLAPVVGIVLLIAGVLYWFGWRVLLPKLGGFDWVERKGALADGTVVTQFDKMKRT